MIVSACCYTRTDDCTGSREASSRPNRRIFRGGACTRFIFKTKYRNLSRKCLYGRHLQDHVRYRHRSFSVRHTALSDADRRLLILQVCSAVIMAQSHCESSPGSLDKCRLSARWLPTLRPSQTTWAVSGHYGPRPRPNCCRLFCPSVRRLYTYVHACVHACVCPGTPGGGINSLSASSLSHRRRYVQLYKHLLTYLYILVVAVIG